MSYHLSLQVQITTDLEFLFPYMCNDGSSDLMTSVFKKKDVLNLLRVQVYMCSNALQIIFYISWSCINFKTKNHDALQRLLQCYRLIDIWYCHSTLYMQCIRYHSINIINFNVKDFAFVVNKSLQILCLGKMHTTLCIRLLNKWKQNNA